MVLLNLKDWVGGRLVLVTVLAAILVVWAGCTWQTKGTYEADGNIPMLGEDLTTAEE